MKLFIGMLWRSADERQNTINLTEKALKTTSTYIDNQETKKILEDVDSTDFIKYIVKNGIIKNCC